MSEYSPRPDAEDDAHAGSDADGEYQRRRSAGGVFEECTDADGTTMRGSADPGNMEEEAGKKRKRRDDDDDDASQSPLRHKTETQLSDEEEAVWPDDAVECSSATLWPEMHQVTTRFLEAQRHQRTSAEPDDTVECPSATLWPEMHEATTRFLEAQRNQPPDMKKVLQATLDDSHQGTTAESVSLYQSLLKSNCPVPSPSLFDESAFCEILERLRNRGPEKVASTIGTLLVPSVDQLSATGDDGVADLCETVFEPWTECIPPFTDHEPAPAYSVGFASHAFTPAQHGFVDTPASDDGFWSLYKATPALFFPFLFVEVQCASDHGDERLEGDESNAHSAMVAVRAVVELFTHAGRADEIERQVVAFSVVYDRNSVGIYGHYAEVGATSKETRYYRCRIGEYALGTRDRWKSYRFVMALYREWAPMHLGRIRSAVDSIVGTSNV